MHSDALGDLLPFVQFKKRKKHPWRSVTFSKSAGFSCRLKPAFLVKVTLLHGCFSRFVNCPNGTKSRKASYMFRTQNYGYQNMFGKSSLNSEILAKKSYSFIVKKSEEIGKKNKKKNCDGDRAEKDCSFLLKC